MSWTSTRTTHCIAVVSLLAGCSGPPMAPEPRGAPAEPATVDRPGSLGGTVPEPLRAWFAARGVQLPTTIAPEPAAKAASGERLLGDGSGNGVVNFYDLVGLWSALTAYSWHTNWFVRHFDMDLLDIDRSGGRPNWIDLGLLGDFLYGSRANPHGIGERLGSPAGFQIELVFADDFLYSHRAIVREAADRWEQIIIGDLRDIDFKRWPFDSDNLDWWPGLQESFPFLGHVTINEVVDDLRIYVGYLPTDEYSGWAQGFWVRTLPPDVWLPVLGALAIHKDAFANPTEARKTALHEIAHVLGFSSWDWGLHNLMAGEGETRHLTGTLTRSAFASEGGWRYRSGPKVPVEATNSHWKESAFGDELMSLDWHWNDSRPLSLTTVQHFADQGYKVDAAQADRYEVPASSAKPAPGMPAGNRCGVGALLARRLP